MASAEYETYEAAKERLDQIVTDVRDKEISLEASLDLLDEGVELANRCTELIDVASWASPETDEDGGDAGVGTERAAATEGTATEADDATADYIKSATTEAHE